jgi:hypothetical protein
MSGKKLQKHCRIFLWVEGHDPALAQAIRDLCMEGALSPGRGSPGVTFLYPTAAVRKEIIEKAYGADAEDALRLLDANIIPEVVRTPAEFRRAGGNRLGVQLKVIGTEGTSVRLEGGAVLRPSEDFSPLRKDNIAVWCVEEGALPTEGPAAPKTAAGRPRVAGGRGRRRAHGGAGDAPPSVAAESQPLLGDMEHLSARAVLAAKTEAAFNACMLKDRCRAYDPYLDVVASLLLWLQSPKGDPDRFLGVLPLIDRDPVSCFYILLEPYKTRGDFLLPDDVLFGGPDHWNAADMFLSAGPKGTGALSAFEGFFASLPLQTGKTATITGGGAGRRPRRGGGVSTAPGEISSEPPMLEQGSVGANVVPLCFSSPGSLRSAIDIWRTQTLVGEDGTKADVGTPEKVRDTYIASFAENKFPGMRPVFPDITLQMLRDPLRKVWQDELRIVVHCAMEILRRQPSYSEQEFTEVVRMLRFTRPGNDYSVEASITNAHALRTNVDRRDEFDYLIRFINSTDFHYFAVPSDKIGGGWNGIPTSSSGSAFQDRGDLSIANTEASKQEALKKARAGGVDDPRGLPGPCVDAIRRYVDATGRLPPELGLDDFVQGPPPASDEEGAPDDRPASGGGARRGRR